MGIIFTFIPWIVWIIFREKKSTGRLLYAGTFVALISLTLDNVGVQLSAWNYLKPVTPLIPSYIPFDFSLMPISVMFLIQWFYNRNPWIIGFIFGITTAFIGEPIFKWLGLYDPTYWKFGYSVPFYTFIYYIAHKTVSSKNFKELGASK
ncbi:CBO0543 family protein [Neobacillus vireti]|uniref:CBO0543 family protein n=1 Tax=Neobacillus vireti TaxID=220686 RepID=UPI002FFE5AA3